MFKPSIAASLFLAAAPLAAQSAPVPITAADMMRHIEVLASDQFGGRAPGSAGERLTTDYIVQQLQSRGLQPAGENGSWLQPLRLVERVPAGSRYNWSMGATTVDIPPGEVALAGKEASESLTDAPVVFAGLGVPATAGGADPVAGTDVHGAVVLILAQAPIEGLPSVRERVRLLQRAGAAAVIAIAPQTLPWDLFTGQFSRGATRLDADPVPELSGVMRWSAAERLLAQAGGDFPRLLSGPLPANFRAAALPIRLTAQVNTAVERFTTNNVIGRLRGSGSTGENVMILAHWDHLGTCRPPAAPDRICNGAVDNASGVAMMIEVAGRLAQGPRPTRDLLVMATTAEEEGEIGADYFATHPTVPLGSIVAAVNLDTVAIGPAGDPVGMLNRSVPALNAAVEATATALGRRLDTVHDTDPMTERQDGYRLSLHGVPAIMVGESVGSMARLNTFLNARYHGPDDEADGTIEMGGATEDANLLVALARRLADPTLYAAPVRNTR